MPDPRTIALGANRRDAFDPNVSKDYDPAAGTPAGAVPQTATPDYAANPVNPPDEAAPAANLKR